jgi:Dolichyl-phosphate-mannose-protein mannosyltransferase
VGMPRPVRRHVAFGIAVKAVRLAALQTMRAIEVVCRCRHGAMLRSGAMPSIGDSIARQSQPTAPVAWLAASRVSRGSLIYLVSLLAAGGYIVAFAGTGVLRAIYPYPIDGLEPGALQEVRRLLVGQPLYVAPDLGYVPLIYGPVYFYTSAAVAATVGSPLLGMRLVSLLASLGSIALVVQSVRRETGSLGMGLVGGGLLAACGPLVNLSMDVGRMDALSLFFVLAAISAARQASLEPTATWRMGALSGALLALGVLTKQTSLSVGVALLIALVVLNRRQIVPFAASCIVTIALGIGLLTLQSGSWPWFYLWQLPRGHELRLEFVPRFWNDVLSHFTIPVVVGPFFLLGRWLAADRRRVVFHACALLLGLVGMAWLSDVSLGAGRNVQLPGYAAFSILFALALHEVLRRIGADSAQTSALRAYVLCVAVAQFAILLYNPRLVVPYRSDMWDGDRLTATLAALPGPIFAASYQGYLMDPSAVAPDLGAVSELYGVFGGGGTPEGTQSWDGQFAQALVERRFTYLIVDPDIGAAVVTDLAGDFGYKDAGPLFPPGDKYWDWRTGWAPKAEVYVRS